jgi:hypothetical protein
LVSLFAQSDTKELLAVAPGEEAALVAIGLESTDPSGAREAWERYVAASPDGPWVAHARAHLAALPAGKRSPRNETVGRKAEGSGRNETVGRTAGAAPR